MLENETVDSKSNRERHMSTLEKPNHVNCFSVH